MSLSVNSRPSCENIESVEFRATIRYWCCKRVAGSNRVQSFSFAVTSSLHHHHKCGMMLSCIEEHATTSNPVSFVRPCEFVYIIHSSHEQRAASSQFHSSLFPSTSSLPSPTATTTSTPLSTGEHRINRQSCDHHFTCAVGVTIVADYHQHNNNSRKQTTNGRER